MRIAVAIALLICAATAQAQPADTTAQRPRWASAFSFGVPGAEGAMEPSLFTLGGNFTQIGTPLGADLAVFTMPRVFQAGAIPLIARGGLAAPLALDPNTYLVPSAGVVAVTAIGSGGGFATGGFYGGVAFMAFADEGGGFRAAWTVHQIERTNVWHLEVGFVGRSGR